jgi:hypothetical protein
MGHLPRNRAWGVLSRHWQRPPVLHTPAVGAVRPTYPYTRPCKLTGEWGGGGNARAHGCSYALKFARTHVYKALSVSYTGRMLWLTFRTVRVLHKAVQALQDDVLALERRIAALERDSAVRAMENEAALQQVTRVAKRMRVRADRDAQASLLDPPEALPELPHTPTVFDMRRELRR